MSANCDAVIRLAQLYDAFHAITRETGDTRTRAAAQLYPTLATMDIEAFADEIDAGFSNEGIIEGLNAARSLSREIIMDADISPFRILDNRDEAQFLAQFITRSRCLDGASGGGGGASDGGDADQDDGERILKFGPKSGSQGAGSFVDTTRPTMLIFLIVGGVLGLAATGTLVAKSRRVRIHLVERLPRHRIRFDFPATYTNAEGTSASGKVTALDVSLGGMKLKVPELLRKGTALDLALPSGQRRATVIWSNTHYAGILFDERLEDAELQVLLKSA